MVPHVGSSGLVEKEHAGDRGTETPGRGHPCQAGEQAGLGQGRGPSAVWGSFPVTWTWGGPSTAWSGPGEVRGARWGCTWGFQGVGIPGSRPAKPRTLGHPETPFRALCGGPVPALLRVSGPWLPTGRGAGPHLSSTEGPHRDPWSWPALWDPTAGQPEQGEGILTWPTSGTEEGQAPCPGHVVGVRPSPRP